MPAGTPGFVLTVQANGVDVAPEAVSGGTLVPLKNVAFCDSATIATTHDGNIESPFVDVQDAIDAGFTNILLCPGAYGNVALSAAVQYFIAAFGAAPSLNPPSIGTITTTDASTVALQGVSPSAIDDSASAGPVILELIDVVMSGPISGSGATVIRTGTVLQNTKAGFEAVVLQDVTAAGAVSLAFTRVAGDIQCSVLDAIYSRGSDVICTDSGISHLSHSAFADVTFDTCECDNVTITGDLAGDANGGMVFRNSLLSGDIQSPVTWDATTERRSLAAGCSFSGPDFVLALSSGQGGPAKIISSTPVTFTYNDTVGPTNEVALRAIVPRGVGVNVVATLDETGGIDLQPYLFDCWQSGNTVTIKDSAAATLQVVASNTATHGTRNQFKISESTHVAVQAAPLASL